jgi:hypothetical protein
MLTRGFHTGRVSGDAGLEGNYEGETMAAHTKR